MTWYKSQIFEVPIELINRGAIVNRPNDQRAYYTFNIFPLTMMENVVDEINEMKAKLKGDVFLRYALKQVMGEHLREETGFSK